MSGRTRILIVSAMIVTVCAAGIAQVAQRPWDKPDFDWKAFHRKNDAYWAKATGLSTREVRALRLAAGIEDDEPSNPIDWIDVKRLSRGHILFVTAGGSGHCLNVAVFVPHWNHFRELWSAAEKPDGAGFCHPSLCRPPEARASKKGEITVIVPEQSADSAMGVCNQSDVLIYRWNGTTYALAERKSVTATQCGLDNYFDALHTAFSRLAEPGETLAMVERLPALRPESAVVFQRVSGQIKVVRVVLEKGLWSQISYLTHPIAPADCVAMGRSAPAAERKELAITSQQAEKFLADLSGIDRQTEKCPRRADGSCGYVLDGTFYAVYFPDGSMSRITGLSPRVDLISENPALLCWVNSLLQTSK
ncbi:MAG TPA: hypothetical protein VJA94_10455 [Candidatus Angelobacter sp.]